MPKITHRKKRLSSFKLIVLGFAGVIVLGALILMLPFSSTAGVVTPFHEALFTSTSAVCVTGLVVQDTGSYWSAFGQTVILLLIQIGGLGVVTVAAFFAMLSGRKISLMQRSTLQDAISAPKVGGIVRLWRHDVTGAELLSVLNDDENKSFGVSFRTPPKNSTGVAHILEHSVLCGSEKYPVKEPFVELLKSSLQTFLNALTFPDKTCYPVASTNLRDFYNLVDVYIDAVFHPRIDEDVLRQEGWDIVVDEEGRWSF